ncbi:MAG: substrate-binding domain-containing protein [Pseudolysinimonas sp.]
MSDALEGVSKRKGAADIGLVIPDLGNPFFPTLVQAVEQAARARGIGVLIANTNNDADIERDAFRMLIERRVGAILVSATHTTDSVATIEDAARVVPTIQLDRIVAESLPWVRADQAAPIAAIVTHLQSSRRQHLAFIGQLTTIPTSVEREATFTRLMAEGFADQPLRIVKEAMSPEIGRAAAREIMATWPETDAIICANDLVAVGVLLELGIQPGRREVAISGFDDTLIARSLRLTSVRQPVGAMADAALTAVLDPAGVPAHLAVELQSEVMLRFSTA